MLRETEGQGERDLSRPAGEGDSTPRSPRVAIIAVHGVAHHDPGATANAMSDLLLSLPGEVCEENLYSPFTTTGIRVPLRMPPVRPLTGEAANLPDKPRRGVFEEQSAQFAQIRNKKAAARNAGAPKGVVHPPTHGEAGNEYMRLLLQDYRGGADGNFYATTRLEGRRLGKRPEQRANVHIYEMLWADLARPTNTILSFLLSLFQLVLHLGSLSRLAVDSGAGENSGWQWSAFSFVQRHAVRVLQMPIPLLKVTLLIALASCVPSLAAPTRGGLLFPILMAGLAGLVLTFLFNTGSTWKVKGSPWAWALRAIFPAAAGVAVAAYSLHRRHLSPDAVGACECWILLGSALIAWVLKSYESVRRGVWLLGSALFLLLFAVFVYYLHAESAQTAGFEVPQATLWTAVWIMAALRSSWIVLFVLAALASLLGSLAWRSIPKAQSGKRARARAAVRTSRFALALPSILFLLITTMLWAGMFRIARAVHHPFFDVQVLSMPAHTDWLARCSLVLDPRSAINNAPGNSSDYLHDVLQWSVTKGFGISLALLGAALFLLLWWALPGVVTETFPLRDENKPPRFSTNERSERMGTWTSRGLDATSVLTFLFWTAIFAVPPLFLLAPVFSDVPALSTQIATLLSLGGQWSSAIVHSFVAGVTAAALAAAIHYGSPVLGAILDVDTYLRASPTDATPRAKIVERYVSLLRYVARYRGADGRGYDSVVIVAHSLGTLISADLLRFLKEEGLAIDVLARTNDRADLPISLLTMGSPIRQLLNRFFPFLYDWVRSTPDNGLTHLPACAASTPLPKIEPLVLPDPAELGITKWVNVYRSGDYVGRSLWLDEWYTHTIASNATQAYRATDGSREEACIGAGAHTHYWDDTAPDVAEILDSLI
jgi:hypothetical protein